MASVKFLVLFSSVLVASAVRRSNSDMATISTNGHVSVDDGELSPVVQVEEEKEGPTDYTGEAVTYCEEAIKRTCLGDSNNKGYCDTWVRSTKKVWQKQSARKQRTLNGKVIKEGREELRRTDKETDIIVESTCKKACKATRDSLWSQLGLGSKKKGLSRKFNKLLKKGSKTTYGGSKYGAMKALMREHLLKCICVNRKGPEPAINEVCYQGSQGINMDVNSVNSTRKLKWCQFGWTKGGKFGMGSWRLDTQGVLTKFKENNHDTLPEPLSPDLCDARMSAADYKRSAK